MRYPNHAYVEGVKYPIDTDYRVALECFHIIEDDSIGDTERTYAVIYKLFHIIPKDEEISDFVRIASEYLGCGEKQEDQKIRKKDMDFQQDWKYIVASFMSDYHIDINQNEMHWYQFINLIQGLTDNSIMSRIRELRNYDLNEVKDQKTKRRIMEAQKSVELSTELSQEEKQIVDQFESLFM